MGKRFIKFRVSRVISPFQSCRPKDTASLPANPVPSFRHLAPATTTAIQQLNLHRLPPHPNSKTHNSIKRHVSSALLSARRSFLGSRPTPPSFPEDAHTESSSSFQFQWEKDPQWHVIAKTPDYNYNYQYTPPRPKIYNSGLGASQNDVVLFPPLQLKNNRKRRSRRKRASFQKVSLSTSSDSGMIFSEEDEENKREISNDENEEEIGTLVSTTDDSTSRHRSAAAKAKKKKKERRSAAGEEGTAAPARLSEFMRRMVPCRAVEGKVRESFAVVKRSADPYDDFKRSMAEMVVEKQMFEAEELEELLRCFLSLNSAHHHGVIVKAYAEIWEALFSQASS